LLDPYIRNYLFNKENPTGPLRSKLSYEEDLATLEQQRINNPLLEDIKGVKGKCALAKCKYFNPVESTCIDYMHSVLEGVGKNFFKYWFELPTNNTFSLKKYMKEIDIRVKSIRPPSFVPSSPRSIYDWNKWKAHDYLAFYIYYAIPVFNNIMSYEYISNLKKFVLALEILLERNIKVSLLPVSQLMLEEFVSELESLYNKNIMLSGVHELLHLVQCTLDFGPLNNINSFQFEELNRKLIGLINGNDLIGEEFIKVFTVGQVLSCHISNNNHNAIIREFFNDHKFFKTSNLKNINKTNNDIKILDKKIDDKLQILDIIRRLGYALLTENEEIYSKISFKGIIYSNLKSVNKMCDFCIRNKRNFFGLIVCFFKRNNKFYLLAKKVSIQFSASVFEYQRMFLESKMFACMETDEFFVEEITNIEKICLIKIDNQNYYASTFKMSHLFN
jgi:hypothetical protein